MINNIIRKNENMSKITMRSTKRRTILKDVLPLDTPFTLGIFIGDICNFKCKYCEQVVDVKDQNFNWGTNHKGLIKKFMDWETFKKTADQASMFPHKIKTVLFSSMGEPLLNPDLPEMISYLRNLDVGDKYEIITNASLLTHELSQKLVDSGLSRLCISIQGLTKEKYKDICDYDINMDKLKDEISYFYQISRNKCSIHIKTLNISLDEGEDKLFYEIFSPMCDTIFIDQVVEAFPIVDYSSLTDGSKNIYGSNRMAEYICCPTPFYTMYVLADGSIIPCCSPPQPTLFGNIANTTLLEAWNGSNRRNFLKMQLNGNKYINLICKECVMGKMKQFVEDNLDNDLDIIKVRMGL